MADNTSTPTPNPQAGTLPVIQSGNPMKKYLVFIIAGVILLVLSSVGAYWAVTFTRQQTQEKSLSQEETEKQAQGEKKDPTTPPLLKETQITIPISVTDPETTSVGFVYKFITQLTEIKQENGRTQLITTTKNPNPWFVIAPDTEIVFRTIDGKIKPARLQDLKAGQNIEIFTYYGLQSKRWTMQRVFILESNSKPSGI